jgi:hypothetical protein
MTSWSRRSLATTAALLVGAEGRMHCVGGGEGEGSSGRGKGGRASQRGYSGVRARVGVPRAQVAQKVWWPEPSSCPLNTRLAMGVDLSFFLWACLAAGWASRAGGAACEAGPRSGALHSAPCRWGQLPRDIPTVSRNRNQKCAAGWSHQECGAA